MFINKKIALNATIRWTGEILNKLIWFIFMVILARSLGDKKFGYFSYAFSFASLFVVFTDLGTNTLLVKEISKNKEQTNLYFSNILGIKFFLSVIVFLTISVLALTLTEIPKIVILFSLSLLISAFLDPFNSLYRAYKQMHYETFIILIWRILLAGLSLAGLYFFYFGLLEISYVFIFSGVVTSYLTFLIAKKVYSLNFGNIKLDVWKKLIKSSIPLGAIIIFGSIFFKLNTVLLQHFSGAQEVGWYSASFRLLEGTFFIPSIFVASVFPFFCEYSKASISELTVTFRKAFLILFLLAFSSVIAVFVFSKKIITFLYGEQFLPATKSLKIIVWSLIFIFLNELFLYLFISTEKQNKVIKIMSVCVLVYIALCLLLVPARGFIGASWALFLTQVSLFTLYLLSFKKIPK